MGTTDPEAQRIDRLPISSKPGEEKRVVMHLGSADEDDLGLPDLRPGDLIRVTAELELTTDCRHPCAVSDCVQNAYDYSPNAWASLLLAADHDQKEASRDRAIRLSGTKHVICTHREHHKMLVFHGADYRIGHDPPNWMLKRPSINLVASADHPESSHEDILLVGENDPGEDGEPASVGTDKGRINVVRLRGDIPRLRIVGTPHHKRPWLSVDEGDKTVLYSQRIDNLREKEQLAIEAAVVATAAGLDQEVRLSTRVFLTEDPRAKDPEHPEQAIAKFGGEISENNGYNCLPEAGHQVSHKFGVLRLQREPKPRMFVNVVAVSGNPLGPPIPQKRLRILRGGFLRVVRYPPELYG